MAADELVLAHYEELRKAALDGLGAPSVGLGAVVLIHQGMAAWMHAWCEYCHLDSRPAGQHATEQQMIPGALTPEVAVVLAEMVLRVGMEAG
jgi:hypothetical protein